MIDLYDVQIKFRLFDRCIYVEDIKYGKQKLNSTWLLQTNLNGSHASNVFELTFSIFDVLYACALIYLYMQLKSVYYIKWSCPFRKPGLYSSVYGLLLLYTYIIYI